MIQLHRHLLILWTFTLGAQVLPLHHLHYIIVICHDWRLSWWLRLSYWSFPCKQSLRTQWQVGVAGRLGCFLQQNLNYRRAHFSNKQALTISRVQRHMANRYWLLHLILSLKWLLHLMGSFLMQYVAVGYSFFHYLLLTLLKWLL